LIRIIYYFSSSSLIHCYFGIFICKLLFRVISFGNLVYFEKTFVYLFFFLKIQIFARQVGGVSLVTRRCSSFRERFFLCQKMADIVEALATAEDGDEVILCPGVYERREEDDPFGFSGLKVFAKIHILGCCFNLNHRADLDCNHPQDLPSGKIPNIVLRSQYTNALDWRASEGSITNLHLEYLNPDPNKYFFSLKVENEFPEDDLVSVGLVLKNVSVSSQQQMAMSCQPRSHVTAINCRFHNSEGWLFFFVNLKGVFCERFDFVQRF
jgi:hypothetical protein